MKIIKKENLNKENDTFREFHFKEVKPFLKRLLKDKFNITKPFKSDEQEYLLYKFIEEDKDPLIGILPTNSGKSLIYQAGSLILGKRNNQKTVVISPLISLMNNQMMINKKLSEEKNLYLMMNRFGIIILNSNISTNYYEYYMEAKSKYRKGDYNLIYCSPERFRNEGFLNIYKRQNISRFVIDEMHCITIWGNSFRYEYKNLANIIKYHNPKVVLLTASANRKMIRNTLESLSLDDSKSIMVRSEIYRPEIKICKSIEIIDESKRPQKTLKLLKEQLTGKGKVIVFTAFASKSNFKNFNYWDAESLSDYYRENAKLLGLRESQIDYYHAQRNMEDRSYIQVRFLNGDIRLLVVTKAFGMGIDISNIRSIVHIYPPINIEEYYQEIGRGGRNASIKNPCKSLLLWSKKDEKTLKLFLQSKWDLRALQIYFLIKLGVIIISEDDPKYTKKLSDLLTMWMKNRLIKKYRNNHLGESVTMYIIKDRASCLSILSDISDIGNTTKDIRRIARCIEIFLSVKNNCFFIPPKDSDTQFIKSPVVINFFKNIISDLVEQDWIERDATDTIFNGKIFSKYRFLVDKLNSKDIEDFNYKYHIIAEEKKASWTKMKEICKTDDQWRLLKKYL